MKDPAGAKRTGSKDYRLRLDNRFDGDKTSSNMVYTDEAVAEVHRVLNSPSNYIDSSGGLLNSSIIDTVKRVFENMSGD